MPRYDLDGAPIAPPATIPPTTTASAAAKPSLGGGVTITPSVSGNSSGANDKVCVHLVSACNVVLGSNLVFDHKWMFARVD